MDEYFDSFNGLNNPKEPIKINATPSVATGQTIETSVGEAVAQQPCIPAKGNSAISNMDIHKTQFKENNISKQIILNDTTTNNLAIQKPEPIYFEDPSLLIPKESDSASEHSKKIDAESHKNDTTKRRKAKIKGKELDFKYSIDNPK